MGLCSVRGSVGREKSRANETYCWCWFLLAACITNKAQGELRPRIKKNNYRQIRRHIQLIGFTLTSKQRLVPVLITFCVHTHRNLDIFILAQWLSARGDGKEQLGLQVFTALARQRVCFIFDNAERRRSGRYCG